MTTYFAYCGLLASIWIIFGVLLVAKRYPSYNHKAQFCSELGAKGSPTEKLSPLINNYPLGLLFCLFGVAVIQMKGGTIFSVSAGIAIVIHGIGTWIAGYFPMDADAYTKTPSLSCKIHSWAGFIMLISLLLAPILMLFSQTNNYITFSFKAFSLLTVITTIYFMQTSAKAYKSQINPGLHQRLCYGVQLIWLSVLSLILIQ